MSSALQTESQVTKKARTRAVTLATLGNVMEWYDFTVYGFLALAISANFFPGSDPNAALLSTFAVFGVGLWRVLSGRLSWVPWWTVRVASSSCCYQCF
ncbi:proline/betaine transporter [Arthrobacter sp. Hiyo8]|nr:proline/betaine transporter [Arthrobacter sp. Hiyo8]